jgi:uncharacterized membrane protein YphA (DoxX/SURF4 family)
MAVLAVSARLVLLWVFIAAARAHLTSRSRLPGVIRSLGLPHAAALAAIVTVADAGCVAALAVSADLGALAAALYLAMVTIPLGLALAREQALPDCGCGSKPKPVDRSILHRNIGLALLPLIMIAGPQPALTDIETAVAFIGVALSATTLAWIRRILTPATDDSHVLAASQAPHPIT